MGNQIKEVLVIDNHEDFAEELVDFIKIRCGVGAIYALNSEKAKDTLKQHPIKIILLDYDLQEPTTGLDLFPELKKIDPNVQIIFISAVATLDVLWKAGDYPFAAKVAKAMLDEKLPQLIPTLLLEYSSSIETINQEVFFSEQKGSLLARHTIDYSIVNFHIIEKEYVFPESWRTYDMIKLGETKSEKEQFDYEHTFELSHSFQISSDFEIGVEHKRLINLKANLSAKMESEIKSGYTEKIKNTISWMRKLSLSGDNSDTSIVSRFYDYAQLYMQIKLFVKKSCSCCESEAILPATIFFPVASIQYRIREYYDGKEPRTINSGVYKA